MRRGIVLALALGAVRPATAQLVGVMPLWNDPRGHANLIAADVGSFNSDAGGGTAFGARLVANTGFLGGTFGVARWSPAVSRPGGPLSGQVDQVMSIGVDARVRILGAENVPVGLNVLTGGNLLHSNLMSASELTLFAGAGASLKISLPGLQLEPFLSMTKRGHHIHDTNQTESNMGWTVGANLALGGGKLGLHFAYDLEKRTPCPDTSPTCSPTTTSRIIGGGLHVILP